MINTPPVSGGPGQAPLVPNPVKKKAHRQVLAARARYDRALAATDAALLDAVSPPPGQTVVITNAAHDRLTAGLRDAETALDTARAAHRAIPARLPLAQVNPGQQVPDVQTKLISHAIRIAAFNTATVLARAIRVHTGYARANHEAHTLVRQALTGSGDIDPGDHVLTVRLDPLPTGRATAAIAQLCEHLTATQTHYPGTDLILRYEVKTRPSPHTKMTPCPEPWGISEFRVRHILHLGPEIPARACSKEAGSAGRILGNGAKRPDIVRGHLAVVVAQRGGMPRVVDDRRKNDAVSSRCPADDECVVWNFLRIVSG